MMKIKRKQIFGMMLLLILTFAFSAPVLAEEQSQISVSIPVSQKFTNHKRQGAKPEDKFIYQLIAKDAQNPMPEGNQSPYIFQMKGTVNQNLPSMVYKHAGVYKYEILQRIKEEKTGYIYDKQVYQIEVYVQNKGRGLTADVIALTQKGEKAGEILFENSYKEKESTEAAKKSSSGKKAKIAKTGDTAAVRLYAAVMFTAFLRMLVLVIKRRTSSEEK